MNVEKIRNDFPLLVDGIKGKQVIYFDNACMSLKPKQVVEAVNDYYYHFPACAGRSHHKLGKKLEYEIDCSRKAIAKFINAKKKQEIVFTRNTTECINLLANTLELKKGDIVLGSDKEHNSNLIPWLRMAKVTGIKYATFRFGDINDFSEKIATLKPKIASFVHVSNIDGTENNAKEMVKIAKENNKNNGTITIIDAAQSIPHQEIDVKKLGCDFLCFSGHKMMGPSGTGVLYGKYDLLNELPQFMVGGETVVDSTYNSFKPEEVPHKFEAGLQHYAGIIGLKAAAEYLNKIGLKDIHKHEAKMNAFITEHLAGKVNILGSKEPEKRSGIFNFFIPGKDPHQIAIMLDQSNIMTRSGRHCCHSWFNANNIEGSTRASLYAYNTIEECGRFVEEMEKILKVLGS